jgi:DNA-binding transcriptional ArsR family regulator
MRALAYPPRLAILEYVSAFGPATATECASAVGLSPSACSYHLRELARHGFVREAERGPDGRKRLWKAEISRFHFDTSGEDVSSDEAEAQRLLEASIFEHQEQVVRAYLSARHRYSSEWRSAAFSLQDILVLTPQQLVRLRVQLLSLLARYRSRQGRLTPGKDRAGVYIAMNALPLPFASPEVPAHGPQDDAE